MANIKSAQKRILVANKKSLQNQMIVSRMKTYIKKFNAAVYAGNIELAESLLPETASIIDNACTKGCIHKNNADRKKASLASRIAALKNGTLVVNKKVERKVKVKEEVVLVPRAEKLAQKAVKKEEEAKALKEAKKTAKAERPTKTEKAEQKSEKKIEKPTRAEKSASAPKTKKTAVSAEEKAE